LSNSQRGRSHSRAAYKANSPFEAGGEGTERSLYMFEICDGLDDGTLQMEQIDGGTKMDTFCDDMAFTTFISIALSVLAFVAIIVVCVAKYKAGKIAVKPADAPEP
jgi:hypothetical protein